MGRALELVTATATAAVATGTDMAAAAGNSLTVRASPDGADIRLLNAWVDAQTVGFFRIRSALMHDNVQGLRFDNIISEVKPLLPEGGFQRLFPQDTLTLTVVGAAVVGDIETACMLLYYADLPGVDAQLMTAPEVEARIEHLVTVENTLALGAGGGYSGEEALTAEFDLLKANRDYALLGYHVDAECAAVRWRGADTGNLGVGGPGDDGGRDYTKDWFLRQARIHSLPLVPVFNSANADGILVDGVQDENGTDATLTTILALLRP